MTRTAVLGETPFAVIDVETTGIYPGAHDRILEVAVVRTTPRLDIEDEWVTLVNPQRDIGRSDIHGIRAGEVLDAPLFEEIAADVGIRLRGAVLVAHHLRFDRAFLAAEYARCGVQLPELPGVCTLDLAFRLLPDAPSRRLDYCCKEIGILHEEDHTALGDARATAQLLARFVAGARGRGLTTLTELGCVPIEFPDPHWFTLRPSGKRRPRLRAGVRTEQVYLAQLVERMPGDEGRNPREAEYLALVDRALQDRRLTTEEARQLIDMAAAWGMTRSDVREAHHAYLASLVSEALADRVVTEAERDDLRDVADLLGIHRATLDAFLAEPSKQGSAPTTQPTGPDLRGKSVCFTGELIARFRGERISREAAEKFAAEAGLTVRPSVTKRLDLLVVADPETQSLKARKAREYGIPIMAERVFWRTLGLPVE